MLHTSAKPAPAAVRVKALGIIRAALGQVTLFLADETRGKRESVSTLALGFAGSRGVLRGTALETDSSGRVSGSGSVGGFGAVAQNVAGLPAAEADCLFGAGQLLLGATAFLFQGLLDFLEN